MSAEGLYFFIQAGQTSYAGMSCHLSSPAWAEGGDVAAAKPAA
jgi:hypothetical protein